MVLVGQQHFGTADVKGMIVGGEVNGTRAIAIVSAGRG